MSHTRNELLVSIDGNWLTKPGTVLDTCDQLSITAWWVTGTTDKAKRATTRSKTLTSKDRREATVMCTSSTQIWSSLGSFPFSQHELVSEEGLLQGWVSDDKPGSWKKHGKRQNANTTLRSKSRSKRQVEHFQCKLFGVTLGLLFATWTSTLHCDLMNSTREVRRRSTSARWSMQSQCWISQLLKKGVQRPRVSQLWLWIQTEELCFSSHKDGKQRVVRENYFLFDAEEDKCSRNPSVKYSVHVKSTPPHFF